MSLYVVQARRNLVKIGMAAKPAARLCSLQTGSTERLRLAHIVPVERSLAVAVERYAHWLLNEFRGSGEWFSVSAEQAATAIREALSAVSDGERQGHSSVGRPPLSRDTETKPTMVRLTASVRARIEAVAGPNRMAEFIREAIEAELVRRERELRRQNKGND